MEPQRCKPSILPLMALVSVLTIGVFQDALGQQQKYGPGNFLIVVTSDQAVIANADQSVTVAKGTELCVLHTLADGSKAWVKIPGEEKFGWISVAHATRKQMPAAWQSLIAQASAVAKQMNEPEQRDTVRQELTRITSALENIAPQHPVLATLRIYLMRVCDKPHGDLSVAQARKAIAAYQPHYGVTSEKFAIELELVVAQLNRVRREFAALDILLDVLQPERRPLPESAFSMRRIAIAANNQFQYLLNGMQYDEFKPKYEPFVSFIRDARAQAVSKFGADDLDVHKWTNTLCVSLMILKNWVEAERMLNDVIESLSRQEPSNDWQKTLNTAKGNLATVYTKTSRHNKAEAIYRSTIAALGDNESNDIIQGNLCRLLEVMDAQFAAETERRKLVQMTREMHGPRSIQLARCLNDLGRLYMRLQLPSNAETAFSDSADILRDIFGEHDLEHLNVLAHVALAQGQQGAHQKELQLLQRVRALAQERFGDDVDIAYLAIEPLLRSLQINNRFEEAERLATPLLASYRERFGDDHPRTHALALTLAVIHIRMSEPEQALPLAEKAVSHYRSALAQANDAVERKKLSGELQHSLEVLGFCHVTQNASLAENILAEAFAIDPPPKSRMAMARTQLNYALMLLSGGKDQEGLAQLHASRMLAAEVFRETIAGVPHETVQPLLKRYAFQDDFAIALSVAFHRPNESTIRRSAEWLINSKGVAQAALAEAGLVELPANAPTLEKLRDTRSQLAKLANQSPEDERWKTFHDQRVATLEQQEKTLANEIRRTRARLEHTNDWLTLDQLQQQLADGAVFVNLRRMRVNQFLINQDKYSWAPARYLAWVITADDVRLIDLGAADAIDELVQRTRLAIVKTNGLIETDGERVAVEALHQVTGELSRRLLAPLHTAIKDSAELFLSPDAALWTVPWEMLETKEDRYLIEECPVRYTISGRELVPTERDLPNTAAPVMFADPDYDGALASSPSASTTSPLRGYSRLWSGNNRFARLKGTAAEARAVAPLLQKHFGEVPQVTQGEEASEPRFKTLKNPKAVIVSTHGYFLRDDRESDIRVDPLLRCGLALAGCNQRNAGNNSLDDGLLTGIEIVGMDLRGTDLVVLSACETGVGDIQTGEGVAGLRMAFQLAGANTVISSLWRVSDQETTRLMKSFFEHLTSGQSKSEALRSAQLDMIQRRRERNGAAHPFFWAAFTVTGRR